MQNQTLSELFTDNKISKYSSNPNDVLIPAKNFYVKLYTKEKISKTAIAARFSKIPKRNNIFTFVRLKFL